MSRSRSRCPPRSSSSAAALPPATSPSPRTAPRSRPPGRPPATTPSSPSTAHRSRASASASVRRRRNCARSRCGDPRRRPLRRPMSATFAIASAARRAPATCPCSSSCSPRCSRPPCSWVSASSSDVDASVPAPCDERRARAVRRASRAALRGAQDVPLPGLQPGHPARPRPRRRHTGAPSRGSPALAPRVLGDATPSPSGPRLTATLRCCGAGRQVFFAVIPPSTTSTAPLM